MHVCGRNLCIVPLDRRQRGETQQREEPTTGESGGEGVEKPKDGGDKVAEEAAMNGDLSRKRVLLEPPKQDSFSLRVQKANGSHKAVGGLGVGSETRRSWNAAETRCALSILSSLRAHLSFQCTVCANEHASHVGEEGKTICQAHVMKQGVL